MQVSKWWKQGYVRPALLAAGILILAGIWFGLHFWQEADCVNAAVCRLCGISRGEPLGHVWQEAGCETPRTCTRCGIEEGEPLGHAWTAAACEEPQICSRCGCTDGQIPGHDWLAADCENPQTCARCCVTEGTVSHSWQEADCLTPRTCSSCGLTEGAALGHAFPEAGCTEPLVCLRCGYTENSPRGHSFAQSGECTRGGIARELPALMAGDRLSFGTWEQDNDPENGSEAIEWLVLEAGESSVLLLSRYGLDARPYHTEYTDITWEQCSLRSWLNTEFLTGAFPEQEQAAVCLTEVDNSRGYPGYATFGGSNTMDHIFLLSDQEAEDYLGENGAVSATPYAVARGAQSSGAYEADGTDAGWWWLRNPGRQQHDAALIHFDGSLGSCYVHAAGGCVRPALRLDLSTEGIRELIHIWQEGSALCADCGIGWCRIAGHSWQEAGCTEPGRCIVCGQTEEEARGHTPRSLTARDPDCINSGLTEGSVCAVCGELLVPQTTIPAAGHSWQEAGCTKPETCTACGLIRGEPLGHSWTPGVRPRTCSRCGLEAGMPALKEGDRLTFGSYQRSGSAEPILWQVLAVAESRALVISCKELDTLPYSSNPYAGVTRPCGPG